MELKILGSFLFLSENISTLEYCNTDTQHWTYLVHHQPQCPPLSFSEMKNKVFQRIASQTPKFDKHFIRKSIHQKICQCGFITTRYRRNQTEFFEKYLDIFRHRLSKISSHRISFICSGVRSWAFVLNHQRSSNTPMIEMGVIINQKIKQLQHQNQI